MIKDGRRLAWRILDKAGGSAINSGYSFGLRSGNGLQLQVNSVVGDWQAVSNAGVITLNQWQHVAVVYDGNTGMADFYVDGIPAGTDVIQDGTSIAGNNIELRIGIRATDLNRDFDGFMDEIRIYNRGLSSAEIASLAAGMSPPKWNGDVPFTMTLEGRADTGLSWSIPFHLDFFTPASAGSPVLVFSSAPTTAPNNGTNGSFTINVTPGTYDIWAKGENTLAVVLADVDLNIEPTTPILLGLQVGGDSTKDNRVDDLDFDELLIVFGRQTSSLTAPEQLNDHNRDGIVDIIDYVIVVENFGISGNSFP